MSNSTAEGIVAQLLANAAGLRFGSASVTVKVHDGRIVLVSYTTTEHSKDLGAEKEIEQL